MKKTLAIAALTTLAGCSTSAGLMSDKANLEGTTKKQAAQMAMCVKAAWGDFGAVNEVKLGEGKVRLVSPTPAGPIGVVNIEDTANGAAYKYYQSGQNFGYTQGKLRGGIQSCK